MKPLPHQKSSSLRHHSLPFSTTNRKRLCLAIAAQLMAAAAQAGPSGGEIVGGSGAISQSGLDTTINQVSHRLAIEWQSFNVASHERVTFVQPGQDAVALNRILGNEGSQILGRIDANGHVILMNPNGVFFGADAVVNVGGLVATGLNIDTSDFLNGQVLLEAVEGTAGTVINQGIIHAATGGNVALIGTQVTNSGLISAHLGHVALVSGQQAVVTFDDQGLLGVAVDRETLESQLGGSAGVINSGTIEAQSGRILLSGSVSQDLFSRAVNSGGMNSGGQVIVHEDGSFTLGASVDVVNTGRLSVAGDDSRAGEVILVGAQITHSGVIDANQGNGGEAGNIHLQSQGDNVRLTGSANIEALGSDGSGSVWIAGDRVTAATNTRIETSGDTAIHSDTQTQLATLRTRNAELHSAGTITQTRALEVADTLHLGLSGGQTTLTHAGNAWHQLSANISGATATLSDTGDLVLGDIQLENATVKITVPGTHSQSAGTNIHLTQSTLQLRGLNLIFNGDGGSTITLQDSVLEAYFRGEAQLVNADIPGTANTGRVYLSTPGSSGFTTWGRAGFSAHVRYLDYELDGTEGLLIEHLNSLNTTIYSYNDVIQSGAIHNSGALNLYLSTGGAVYFNHPDNDFGRVDMNLGHVSYVELTDANSLYLGNIEAMDSSLYITALGAGATIRQSNDTTITLNDSNSVITADIVLLGHNNNNFLRVNNYSNLEVNFTQQAQVVDTGIGNIFWDTTRVTGTQDWLTVTASGSGANGPFRFNANTNNDRLNILGLIANDTSIHTINDVRQTGAIQLSGNLHLDLQASAEATLTHKDNDINTLTMDTSHASVAYIVDRNDIALGDLDLADTTLSITATGTISQQENTAIVLDGSWLYLNSANVFLGRTDQGSGITIYNGLLDIQFSQQAHIEQSIRTPGDFNFSHVQVEGYNDDTLDRVAVTTDVFAFAGISDDDNPLELVMQLGNRNFSSPTVIERLRGMNVEMQTYDHITQTDAIEVLDTLHLKELRGEVTLDNPLNRINRIDIDSEHVSAVTLYASGEILLGNWNVNDSSIDIRAFDTAGNSSIRQIANSQIRGSETDIYLEADGIFLGAEGTSSIQIGHIGILNSRFRQQMEIDGVINLGGFYAGFSVLSSEADNTLTIGEHAVFYLESTFSDLLIDLVGGENTLNLYQDLPVPTWTGPGPNTIYSYSPAIDPTLSIADYNPAKDAIVYVP
jgi:filamentous hemagglutinin family protein